MTVKKREVFVFIFGSRHKPFGVPTLVGICSAISNEKPTKVGTPNAVSKTLHIGMQFVMNRGFVVHQRTILEALMDHTSHTLPTHFGDNPLVVPPSGGTEEHGLTRYPPSGRRPPLGTRVAPLSIRSDREQLDLAGRKLRVERARGGTRCGDCDSSCGCCLRSHAPVQSGL